MARLDPGESFNELKDGVKAAIQDSFPYEGKKHTLKLVDVEIDDKLDMRDVRSQKTTKVNGRTWGVPVYANLQLVDNKTGKVVDTKRTKLATIPKITRRYSYIVDGSERQVDNLWLLKPGVYTRIKQNGELETQFNVKGGGFHVKFDPEKRKFAIRHGGANPPLYPVMKALGVDDDSLQRQWGKEIFEANKTSNPKKQAVEFAKRLRPHTEIEDFDQAAQIIKEDFGNSELRPDVTKRTLGKEFKSIDKDVMLRATNRLLGVSRGEEKPDDRDSLMFKDLKSTEDFVGDRIREQAKIITRKVGNNLDRRNKIGDIVGPDLFNRPIRTFFTKSSLSNLPEQTNPLSMISAHQKTTIMGDEGGVKSAHRVIEDAKLVNPSHLGVLDPIHTPEGTRTGVTLHMALGASKSGAEVTMPLYNVKTGKMERVDAGKAFDSTVVMADEVKWKDGKPSARGKVRASVPGNDIGEVPLKNADYVMTSPAQTFSLPINMVPFLANNSQNRATMSGRHQEQAVALKYREAPLVQSAAGSGTSFDNFVGRFIAQDSPVSGEVVKIKPDGVVIKGEDGKKYDVPIYDDYPLNEKKGVLNSEPTVKVGDKIKKGQLLADTNFTKNGTYAPGTNLNVAYIPARGNNVEDGIVISETASKKLTSDHMYKKRLSTREGQLEGVKKYKAYYPDRMTTDQVAKLDDTGVVKVGQTVEPGDTLVAALAKAQLTSEDQKLRLIHKSLVKPYKDKAVTWQEEHPGKVVAVTKRGKGVTVHVKTEEPAVVGDKIVGRHANKGICLHPTTSVHTARGWVPVAEVLEDDLVCTLNQKTHDIEYQKPTRIIHQHHKGMMYLYEGRRLNLFTTPEHRLYVRTRRGEYHLESAEDCFGKPRIHLRSGNWEGKDLETIEIRGRSYNTEDFLRFFGFWIADGSVNSSRRGWVMLGQSAQASPDTYEEMVRAAEAIGAVDLHKYDRYMSFKDDTLYDWLVQFGHAREKYLPRWVLELSKGQLQLLAEQLFKTDGMVYEDSRHNHTRFELFTSSSRLADDYQELALKIGCSANIRNPKKNAPEEHVVRFSFRDEVWTNNDRRRDNESWVEYDGPVHCVEVPNHVIYTRRKGTPSWCGNCTTVLPDHEMPKTKDGRPVDIMLNPMGVPGRMNVGQILETASSKIAEKTGKPYMVKNFSMSDARSEVEKDLKANNLTDTETLIDPKTGKEIPNVLVGKQYILKLQHQVDKKLSVRSRDAYDRNLVPKGGLPHGGQSMGQLEMYAMLAHGAKHNIREMATLKSDKAQGGDNDELWTALQAGELLPPPRPTFAYNKFMSYMKGMGINIEKDGNSLIMAPMTDKNVLAMSSGEIKDGGRMVKMRTLEEEKGGLFDPTATGGHSGKKWSHMTLKEPMPNPIFEKAVMSVSGIRRPQFEQILDGSAGVTAAGEIVGPEVSGALYGPSAVGRLLDKVDVDAELKKEEARIGKLKGQSLNETNRRVKYLRALKKLGSSASEAYMMKHVPVMPPVMRPLSVMDDGSIQFEDINQVYKHISLTNQKLGQMSKLAPDEERAGLRSELYDELKALSGTGGYLNRQYSGILDIIAGGSPKTGFFQDKLIKRRQDMSMRSTIVPEPSLGIDEAGIPRKAAMELYKPFVVRELRHSAGLTPLQAQVAIKENRELANKALDKVVDDRPLLMKRDPVLHKYGIQAFKPKLVEGKAIKIHPLVCSGFNADFDGDTMSAFVPISKEAVDEARTMHPSNMIFSPASGKAQYTPFHEMQVGLYSLSEVGKTTNKSYSDMTALKTAVNKGEVGPTDVVKVGGSKTTYGRMMIDSVAPKSMRGGKLLADLNYRFTKKEQGRMFQDMAKEDVKTFAQRMDKLKNIGNEQAFTSGFSVNLKDFKVHSDIRDAALKKAESKTARLDPLNKNHSERYIRAYEDALVEIEDNVKKRASKRLATNLDKLEVAAGIKGNGYRQLTAAPVLFTDAKGNVVATPVKKSYSEGLTVTDYWASTSGGRKGILQRTQSTAEPGYLSKQMMNSTMNMLVHGDDCGTTRGISLNVDEPDVLGRYTQAPIKLTSKRVIPAGTIITPEILTDIRNRKITKVVVRSPMKCNHSQGICPKCVGMSENGQLYDQGTNIGVLSAQSLGERGTQLSMKAFHSGGVHAPGKATLADQGLARAQELLNMPQTLKGSATLASANGKVSSIHKDPAGGYNIMVGDKRHYVPADRKMLPGLRIGASVKKGGPLSSGPINPHELLPLAGVHKTQNYLADELHRVYAPEGIRRRHSEVVVKALSNVTKVTDPGDHHDYLRGDFASASQVQHLNRTVLKGKTPIKHQPILRGVKQIPLDVQEDWLARLNHEELKSTVVEGAQRGWRSELHGAHPVPPLVYGAEFGKGSEKEPYGY